ncbi:MAG: bifunctional proline dehydrogenase/L-glutamate gamma-semialdehyde dehydrogenase PutA [Alphaproteobacteria bacterium]
MIGSNTRLTQAGFDAMARPMSDYLYADEAECVEALLAALPWGERRANAVHKRAVNLVNRIRAGKGAGGRVENFLRQYPLSSEEGLSLMTLAEALLRIPDKATADALIRDKVAATNWLKSVGSEDTSSGKGFLNKVAGFGMKMTQKALDSKFSSLSEPLVREAMIQGMRMMGGQFVLGRDIADAQRKSAPYKAKGYAISYDILGEGARTSEDAERYFESYFNAAQFIGKNRGQDEHPSGMSVKLSALHPRYTVWQRDICVPEITHRLLDICKVAAHYNITLIVDAEESERLEISLEIIENIMKDQSLRNWNGFGLAVQAYQKRGLPLIHRVAALGEQYNRRIKMRLVKGAYWDSEIKRAQVQSHPDYPVFTRKTNTDLSYLACAQTMFAQKDWIDPLFGTHNAHTAAAIIEMGQEAKTNFEFQRLHGMGESLFDLILKDRITPVSIYAPVGPQEDLLAYLVRRLLENGANTSFLNRLMNAGEAVEDIVRDPVENARSSSSMRHSAILLPRDLYVKEMPFGRRNSNGLDLYDAGNISSLLSNMKSFKKNLTGVPDTNLQLIPEIFARAGKGFKSWSKTSAEERAVALERYAHLLEEHRDEMMALCVYEARRTIPDALAELREAVDFCCYYAERGRLDFADSGESLPSPTGETNILHLEGRGVFVCISPWNFPLAIFTGQVVAALMAGNAVIVKPAEQTPFIAKRAIELMHQAGIPEDALHLVIGDGKTGAALVAHENVAGVAFTGSTEVAWEINKTLSNKRGPIVPLIAETGGFNAMIVDSSALTEQVVDDVLISAFGSAGQRCSSLRVLCVQDDAAPKILHMLKGAMAEIHIGDPAELSTDVGPLIDQDSLENLTKHRKFLDSFAEFVCAAPLGDIIKTQGPYFAPCAYIMPDLSKLDKEVFGPILHIIRYRRENLDQMMDDLNVKGYGLTLGVHSRLQTFHDHVTSRMRAGNVYINRSIIGAVVGTQPFGGQGLSGTGPKAGGPHYLPRFAAERMISTNTTAAGGNASLVSLGD